MNRVRPWLPVVLVLSANSPFLAGSDTGYASWRGILCRSETTGLTCTNRAGHDFFLSRQSQRVF